METHSTRKDRLASIKHLLAPFNSLINDEYRELKFPDSAIQFISNQGSKYLNETVYYGIYSLANARYEATIKVERIVYSIDDQGLQPYGQLVEKYYGLADFRGQQTSLPLPLQIPSLRELFGVSVAYPSEVVADPKFGTHSEGMLMQINGLALHREFKISARSTRVLLADPLGRTYGAVI